MRDDSAPAGRIVKGTFHILSAGARSVVYKCADGRTAGGTGRDFRTGFGCASSEIEPETQRNAMSTNKMRAT
jgi:hypothetical protein